MPAALPLIAGAFLAAGSIATAVGLTTAFVVAGLAISWAAVLTITGVALLAVSYLARKTPKPDSGGQQLKQKLDPQAAVPIMYGRTATGGTITWRGTWGAKNAFYGIVTVLSAGGPIAGIESYKAGDYPIGFAGSPAYALATVNNVGGYSGSSKLYKNKLAQRWQNGEAPANTTPGAASGLPIPAGAMSGLAHVITRYEYSTDAFPQGLPSSLWTGSGVKLYDPRKDSTYPGGSGAHRVDQPATWSFSENPFLAALQWTLGRYENGHRVYGIGAKWAEVDVASFVTGANVADANNWKLGGVVTTDDDKYAVLSSILAAGGGVPVARGAQIACTVNAPKTSVLTLTQDDIIGAVESSSSTTWRDRQNAIIPKYREETQGWEIIAGEKITNAQFVADDGGEQKTVEVEFPLVQQTAQAHQLATYELCNSREFLTFNVNAKLRLLSVRVGDAITVEAPEIAAKARKCVVIGREYNPSDQNVTLSLKSETDSKHPFALGQSQVAPPAPKLDGYDPSNPGAPAANAWAITDTQIKKDDTTLPVIVVTGAVDDPNTSTIIVEYRPSGTSAWLNYGEFPRTTTKVEISGLTDQTAYDVALSYRTVLGVVGERLVMSATAGAFKVSWSSTVTGSGKPQDDATKGAPPGTIVGDRPAEEVGPGIDKAQLEAEKATTALKNSAGVIVPVRDLLASERSATDAKVADAKKAGTDAQAAVVQVSADLTAAAADAKSEASTARQEAAQVRSDLNGSLATVQGQAAQAQQTANTARGEAAQAQDVADTARTDLASEVARAKAEEGAIRTTVASVKQTADNAVASINDEITARADGDRAISNRLQTVEADYTTKAQVDNRATVITNAKVAEEATARADADSALSNRSTKLEASVAGVSKVVANDYFDNGVEGWTLLDGVTVVPSSYGRSSVIRTQPGVRYNEVRGRKIAITSDKQRFKLKASWRCAAAQAVYYFGVVFYDADGNHVAANDGTGNYPLGPSLYLDSAIHGWLDREVTIGKGNPAPSPYGGTTAIPAGTVYFRPIIFINYTDIPGSVTEIDYFAVEDVTEAVATNALITDEATTRATSDTALSNRVSNTEAKLNGDQDSTLAARIRDEATASVNRDTAIANRTTSLESNFEQAERGNLPPNFNGGDNDWNRNTVGNGSAWVYYEDTRPKNDWSKTDSTVVTGVHAAGGYLYLFPKRPPIPVSSGDVVRLYASLGAYGDCDAQVYFDTRDRAGNVTPNSFNGGMSTPAGFGNNKAGNNRYDVICCEYRVPDGVSAVIPAFVSNANGYTGPIFVRWMKFEVAGAASKLGALINDESTTRANADSALGNRVSTTEAKLNGDQDSTLAARIRDEATASVNRDGALATRTNALEASASAATNSLNPNPTFSMWPDGQTLPSGLNWWNRGSSTVSRTSSTLGRGGYSLMLNSVDGQESGLGWDNIYNTPGWYVLEADCWLQSGPWEGSGVTLGGVYSINFLTDPDTNGGVGEVSYGGVRRFTKLINFGDSAYRTFHPMNHWNGFSSNARAKSMIWLRAVIRPATAGEILAQKANSTADNAQARITDEATARANADSAISGRVSTTEAKLNGDQDSELAARIRREESSRAAVDLALSNKVDVVEAQLRGDRDSTLAARIRDEATASVNRDTAITNRTSALESTANRVVDITNKTFPGFEVQDVSWGYDTEVRGRNTGSSWEPYHIKGAGIAFPPGMGNYLYMDPYGWIKTTPGKRYRAGFWVWQWAASSGYGGNARVYWEGHNQGHTNGSYLGSSSNPPEATRPFYTPVPDGAWHCYASDILVDDAMVSGTNSFWIRPRINIDYVPANAGYVIAGWFFREVTGEFSNAAKITEEATTRADQTSALANRASALETSVNNGATGNLALQTKISNEETARSNADNALATRSTILEAAATNAGNLVPNTAFTTLDGWFLNYAANGGVLSRNSAGTPYQIGGIENNLSLYQAAGGSGLQMEAMSEKFALRDGEFYQVQGLTANHRCRAWVALFFYNDNNDMIAYTGENFGARINAGGQSISAHDITGAKSYRAPDGTVYGRFVVRMYDVSSDGYVWLDRPYVSVVKANTDQWNAYTPGNDRTVLVQTNAKISDEATARAGADSAISGRVSNTEAKLNGDQDSTLAARIRDEATARVTAYDALAGRTTTLESSYSRLPENFRVVCSGNGATSGLVVGAGLYDGAGRRMGDYNRSYTVIVFAMNSNTVTNVDSYDVYGSDQRRQDMANWLNAIEAGRTVVIYTADEPMTGRFERGLGDAMARVGAGEAFFASTFRSHSAYVLIGRAGVGRGGGTEYYQGDVDVSPQAFLDIKFDMVQGRPNLGTGKAAVVLNAKITDEATTRANADSALATRASKIEASYNIASGGDMSANSRFSNWPDGQRNPAGWGDWVSEGNYTITRQGGISGSPYSVYTQHNADAECGFYQVVSTWPGKWVVEVTVRRDAGSLSGSGVTLSGIYNIDFVSDPDTNGQARDSYDQETRTWVKTFDVTQGSLNLHAMAGWSGFGRPRASNYITWFKLSLRPAGPGDIAGIKNAADITAANARINDEATTRANADGALGNRISTTEAQIAGGQDSWLAARIRDEASASASRDSAIAGRTSVVEAQVSNDSLNMLRNGTFNNPGWGRGITGAPTSWRVWSQDNGAYIGWTDRASLYGASCPLQIDRNGHNNGIAQDIPGPIAPGWYSFSVDVVAEDGNWSGSGVHCNFNNGSAFNLSFAITSDTADRYGDIGTAMRRFTWMFYNPAPSNGATLYLMAGWDGFQGGTDFGFVRTVWHRIMMTPSTEGEIAARKVKDANIVARVTSTETAVADATTKLAQARFEKRASVPGADAFISAVATNDNGQATSNVAIGGTQIALYNTENGTAKRAMFLGGGAAVFDGSITANGGILVGTGKLKVQVQAQDYAVSHDQYVSFGYDLGRAPSISFGPCPVQLATDEVYAPYAAEVSATGFRAKLVINSAPQSSAQSTGSFANQGSNIFQVARGGRSKSANGNYTVTVNLSATAFAYRDDVYGPYQ